MSFLEQSKITAILGPTNTGKTHLAIERMLGYDDGVIGFPLRLLARENYERLVREKGRSRVALLTGEEKIIPPRARYFCCTVEAMPLDRSFDFLAVDEIQLAQDPERGHVFTDRLLHSRGRAETLFLGSDSMRPVIANLVPEAEFISRPRFSRLSHIGRQALGKLPPRSAVVAFSAAEVYTTAELIRRRRGGTAVVLGALSPRTRNAQVELFESGEVDYLVATDAIGMGLNLRLDHVAFAALNKFDGHQLRPLVAPEIAQIAGRAGRHMNDGTFGTTLQAPEIDPRLVEAVEDHRFEAQHWVYWRNRSLDFRAIKLLLRSLEVKSGKPALQSIRNAEDHLTLAAFARDEEVTALAEGRESVRLLWDVCQIPDFRKMLSDHHLRLLGRLYRKLIEGEGRLPSDWLAGQLAYIGQTEGDIDQLSSRLAQIRTWTTITHKSSWLEDPAHWQERAREMEDRLSDALHERLTHRFVDRRTTMLVQKLRSGGQLVAKLRDNDDVIVEGEVVGWLEGFRLRVDEALEGEAQRPLIAAARRAVSQAIPNRLKRLEEDDDAAFGLDGEKILWRKHAVGKLKAGAWVLRPEVEPINSDFLEGANRERLRRRLLAWLEISLQRHLSPLMALEEAPLAGAARGLSFQLAEALGTLPRGKVSRVLNDLPKKDRKSLAAAGVMIGRQSLRLGALQWSAESLAWRALLWSVTHERPVPTDCRVEALEPAFRLIPAWRSDLALALGYIVLRAPDGEQALAVRADLLDRLSQQVHNLASQGPFQVTNRLARGLQGQDLELILASFGFCRSRTGDGLWEKQKKRSAKKRKPRRPPAQRDNKAPSPFAGLDKAMGFANERKPRQRKQRS